MNPQARQELLALKAWHEAGREKSAAPSPPPRRATNRELLAQARDLALPPAQRSRAAETLRRQVRSLCAATLARQAPQVTPAELEDLVQETLVRLLQSPPATDPNPAYIARVAANLLIDSRRHRLRRGQERNPISLDDTEDGHTVDLPDPEAAVEETVLQQIERHRIVDHDPEGIRAAEHRRIGA